MDSGGARKVVSGGTGESDPRVTWEGASGGAGEVVLGGVREVPGGATKVEWGIAREVD